MMLSDRINRWRHRHGFGVHSPAGYMIVRDIVNPKRCYRYYCEDNLDVALMSERDRLLCRLAIRLIGRFHFKESVSVRYGSELYKFFRKAGYPFDPEKMKTLLQANGKTEKEPLLKINFTQTNRLTSPREAGGVLLYEYLAQEELESLKKSYPGSLTIESKDFTILYKVPGLSEVSITV